MGEWYCRGIGGILLHRKYQEALEGSGGSGGRTGGLWCGASSALASYHSAGETNLEWESREVDTRWKSI